MNCGQNRIVRMADDGGAGGGDPAPVSTDTPATTSTSDAAPAANDTRPVQAALTDTLLSAEPKKESDPPLAEGEKKGAGEGDKPAPAAEAMKPADYQLELPEGTAPDDPLLVAFLEGAAKGGMDNDSVQAVVSALGPKIAEQMAAPAKLWNELNDKWRAEVKADAKLGGANLDATIATVASGIDLVSTPAEAQAVREALTMTGAGNNPAIVRLLHGMAARLVEKGAVQGKSPADRRSAAAVLYPTHNAAKGG